MTTKNPYDRIGKCIYCGKTGQGVKLKDEHIVPFSLHGKFYLPGASCGDCEKITHAFEGRVASTMYKSFRPIEKIATRRPKDRPKELQMTEIFSSSEKTIEMPLDGMIGTFPLIHFPPPGFLRGDLSDQISWEGTKLSVLTREPKDKSLWMRSTAPKLSVEQKFDLTAYALLLAKIAHCIAVGHLGIDNFDHWLPPYILGKQSNFASLIGGQEKVEPPSNNDHDIKYDLYPYGGNNSHYIAVTIRLFAIVGGPHAVVIAGVTDGDRFKRIVDRHTNNSE